VSIHTNRYVDFPRMVCDARFDKIGWEISEYTHLREFTLSEARNLSLHLYRRLIHTAVVACHCRMWAALELLCRRFICDLPGFTPITHRQRPAT